MDSSSPIITVEGLTKTYGSFKAVDNISFQVCPGEIFGIVGPNGAGKTTTVECLAGLRQRDGGSVTVLGMDPQKDSRRLLEQVGIQLQQAALPADIKVWEALDLYASFYPHTSDWQALLDEWGLTEKRNQKFSRLSGGQKQRLFIALALVNDPSVVFLDELTTGLDPQARRSTWEMISALRDHGKTVILVTHYMDEAEKLCDRVAIIDGGKIIALDTPQALIQDLHADSRVLFTAPGDFTWLGNIQDVHSVGRQNGDVVVSGRGALMVHVASALVEHGLVPANLRSESVTLEDVFLSLTGKRIRD